MTEKANENIPIKLCGDWSITGVSKQLSTLTAHLETLLTGRAADPLPQICVREVEAIDASGYQLLAVFLRHVRGHGLSPVLVNTPDHLRTALETLGFATEFDGTGV